MKGDEDATCLAWFDGLINEDANCDCGWLVSSWRFNHMYSY